MTTHLYLCVASVTTLAAFVGLCLLVGLPWPVRVYGAWLAGVLWPLTFLALAVAVTTDWFDGVFRGHYWRRKR